MSKWVQHRSGDGEKWEVITIMNGNDYWVVHNQGRNTELKLPLSEYIECSPPEEWEDVTAKCDWGNAGEGMEATIFHSGLRLLAGRGYRLRKVVLRSDDIGYKQKLVNAFIVEKRKS